MAHEICNNDPKIKLINLARNLDIKLPLLQVWFFRAGYVVIDADLQDLLVHSKNAGKVERGL